MKKAYLETPFVIRLQAMAVDISLDDIANAINVPLQLDLRDKLYKYGSSFSCCSYAWSQVLAGRVDFRHALVLGLLPEPPWDTADTDHIERAFAADDETLPDKIRAAARHMEGEDLAIANLHLAALLEADETEQMEYSWTVADMHRYIRLELPRRIYRMLDEDVVTGKLILSGSDKRKVRLDHLVEWASWRAIVIEQDPLANCLPLVVDSYNRLRQRMASAATAQHDTSKTKKSPISIERTDAPTENLTPVVPISRAKAQEAAILTAIMAQGMDPKRMPKHPRGQATVKADIRAHLTKTSKNIFQSGRTFNTAWQRLRDQAEVSDE